MIKSGRSQPLVDNSPPFTLTLSLSLIAVSVGTNVWLTLLVPKLAEAIALVQNSSPPT